MKALFVAYVLLYMYPDVDASFFTWVAQTINPVFNKVFPEAYFPTPQSNLPLAHKRKPDESSDELEGPPIFYVDKNNTIRGLLRKHDDQGHAHHEPIEEEVINPTTKKCDTCIDDTKYGEKLREKLAEVTEMHTQTSEPTHTPSNIQINHDPSDDDIRRMLEKLSDEMNGSDTKSSDELSKESDDQFKTFGTGSKSPFIRSSSTRLPRNTTIETNMTSCDECLDRRDKYLFTPDRVHCHGYRSESHLVLTADGYLLNIFRILPSQASKEPMEPVLLSHGLLGSSDDWLLIGRNKSLVYKLIDAGYDVWLANTRGNIYSKGYLGQCTQRAACYWRFSWQDIGVYDTRATIDHIVKTVQKESGREKIAISYIGHSMGATALLVLLSIKPQYNAHIKMAILLAPLAFMSRSMRHLQNIVSFGDDHPDYALQLLGNREAVRYEDVPSWWLEGLEGNNRCEHAQKEMCTNALFFVAGPILGPMSPCLMADVLRNVPAGGSFDTLRHYAQNANSGRFRQRYGSEFRINQITAPIALFSSKNDTLATEANVHKLYLRLKNTITYKVLSSLSHTEFIWGTMADRLVYQKVLSVLKSGLALVDSSDVG